MRTIPYFNDYTAKELREELNAALALVEKETGLKIKVGKCRYQSNKATYTIEALTVQDGVVFDEAATDFEVFCGDYGLEREHLGQVVTIHGNTRKIVGLKKRNRKFPIILEDVKTGKRYKYRASTIKAALLGDMTKSQWSEETLHERK